MINHKISDQKLVAFESTILFSFSKYDTHSDDANVCANFCGNPVKGLEVKREGKTKRNHARRQQQYFS